MVYNTRRKSLSLPSLGIALPGAPRSARSPPSAADSPPSKKVKRTHPVSTSSSSDKVATSPPRSLPLRIENGSKSAGRVAAHTPPPSPGGMFADTKVDTQGIDDTIVVAVIEQLEKTGNRPHLLRELATVLSSTIPIVESSASPTAIISSRITAYLRRNWTALSRCPLAKTVVGKQPKRIYIYLTTMPHQPIPEVGSTGAVTRIISPSLSSAASSAEGDDALSRVVRSPSPELDLSTPDEDGIDQFGSYRSHTSTTVNMTHSRRAQSPPLEKEEKEFTQTAMSLQQQRQSQEQERKKASSTAPTQSPDVAMDDAPTSVEESEESAALKNSETAAALFGQEHVPGFKAFAPSSPALPPMHRFGESKMTMDDQDWTWAMQSPENVDLDELDDLLGDY